VAFRELEEFGALRNVAACDQRSSVLSWSTTYIRVEPRQQLADASNRTIVPRLMRTNSWGRLNLHRVQRLRSVCVFLRAMKQHYFDRLRPKRFP